MTREVTVRGKRVLLEPSRLLGQGGEAEVFDIRDLSPRGADPLALKIWKPPAHPDFAGSDEDSKRNREAAKRRIKEYGAKIREFPRGASDRVVIPLESAIDPKGAVAGYSMLLVEGAEHLLRYSQHGFRRRAGINAEQVIEIFRDLHASVRELHARGVVIGDFNPKNVLVRGDKAFLIDADSFQFGRYVCRAFWPKFVDPLICDQGATHLIQARPHSADTDWYAFALMLFESLMFAHPYDGVYVAKSKRDHLTDDMRPLRRVTVFHPQVVYPVKATPLSWLPGPVKDYYTALLHDDARGEFPFGLLDALCARASGRYAGPFVSPARVSAVLKSGVGAVKICSVANGEILAATAQLGVLRHLVYEDGAFTRERGEVVVRDARTPALHFKIHSDKTLLSLGGQLLLAGDRGQVEASHTVDSYQGKHPVFDSNGRNYFWLSEGQLYRDGALGPQFVGRVLRNQTLMWVGPAFGVGFYRAGGMTVGFTFDGVRSGLNDNVKLPAVRGEVVDSACVFTERRAWLFVTTVEHGRLVNMCVVIKPDGTVTAHARAPHGNGSWLGSITGRCAALLDMGGKPVETLLVATDNGIEIVAESGGQLTSLTVLDKSKGLVDSGSELIWDRAAGLFAVNGRDIWRIEIR